MDFLLYSISENGSLHNFYFVTISLFSLFSFFFQTKIMSYGSTAYPNPPPAYDEEAGQPFLGSGDDDMLKETIANSSREVRLRK